MGKSRTYDKEYRLIDHLKKENSKLKRENSKLRRENDRYKNLRTLVSQQCREEAQPIKSKRDWTCFQCGRGVMKLHPFPRRDGMFYYRKCTLAECGHQTTLKKYTDDVEES